MRVGGMLHDGRIVTGDLELVEDESQFCFIKTDDGRKALMTIEELQFLQTE